MGLLKDHCEQSLKRYDVSGADIHTWMDEPVKVSGKSHRKWRHDPMQTVPKMFVDKYGHDIARYIMIDHILMDNAEGDPETRILRMLNGKRLDVWDVADQLGKSRSNTQRYLKRMTQAGLLSRSKVCIGIGGYKHLYKRKP